MNIPQDTLQQVADAAFLSSNGGMMGLLTCNKEKNHVFWHEERYERRAVIQHAISNPALAPFLAGVGEYTDEEIRAAWTVLLYGEARSFEDRLRAFLAAIPRHESQALVDLKSDLDGWKDRAVSLEGQVNEAIARAEKAEKELAAIKSSLPAAQVPLGPEDCPPGSVVRCDTDHWFQVLYASPIGVCINNVGLPVQYRWIELAERWQINYSIPDTGRWDATAWRPCSKPGK